MNIVIPMVGMGKRFSDAGFVEPKPLIKVNGKEIVRWSIESLNLDGKYIFITRKYENKDFNIQLEKVIKRCIPDSLIISIDYLTEGATQSVLLAEQFINNKENLIVTNCDQFLTWDYDKSNFLELIKNNEIDGCVTTYNHISKENIIIGDKTPYSFIKIDENNKAIKLSEKIAISKNMLNGIHYWKNGNDFVRSANNMINKNIRYNNEFYVSLTYNELIEENKVIKHYHMSDGSFMSLGTPEDIKIFMDKK
jgi:NDP-sugar pyrophosphorylase family protein